MFTHSAIFVGKVRGVVVQTNAFTQFQFHQLIDKSKATVIAGSFTSI
ncbi:MAG: hypothetical protein ACOZBL_06020 [Patescibacteria group bacterium]